MDSQQSQDRVSTWKLLVLCAQPNAPIEKVLDLWQQSASQIDWSWLVTSAARHGVSPLVFYNLDRCGVFSHIPNSAARILRESYYATAARNAYIYKALYAVLSTLKRAGYLVIVLKGAALADTAYPTRATRQMGDIDLLVESEKLTAIESELGELAYIRVQDSPEHHYREDPYHMTYVGKYKVTLGIPLEVHWHIDSQSRPFQIKIEGLWERAMCANIAGVETALLSAEDTVLHLCLHACKHGLSSLRLFSDIGAVIGQWHGSINWEVLVARAHEWHAHEYVYVPLRLAREIIDAEIPEPVLSALKPKKFDEQLIGWAIEELREQQSSLPILSLRNMLDLWRAQTFKEKLFMLSSALSPGVIAERYALVSSKRAWLYRPLRILGLFARHGRSLWNLLVLGDKDVVMVARRRAAILDFLAPFDEPWMAHFKKDQSVD